MNAEPFRILIVDDSRIFRGAVEEALAGRRDLKVVGSVWSGEKALEFARATLPDFVTLDIEMPGMGGIETLKQLRELAQRRGKSIGILLLSSHTRHSAEVTVDGLEEGAFDFVTKPDGPDAQRNAASLKEQLLSKIDGFRSRRPIAVPIKKSLIKPRIPLRRETRFGAVLIASSTGGPEALTRLLPILASDCPVPLFLVQHLPPDFTPYFASSLTRRCGAPIVEATEGELAQPGVVYVAPGGRHLVVKKIDGNVVTGISDSPSENGCRPAADVLFRSAALAYSGQVIAVVLTGMGNDGAKGATILKRAGGYIIAQDEATSVVWGMPGSVVGAGVADEVLPICEIAPRLRFHLGIEG